jgi:hypothetical protein
LAAGPDVWEVIGALRDQQVVGAAAVEAVAEFANLTVVQVRAAVRYYADYADEIDERIRRNREAADEEEARWQREQRAIA